jgi:hypothetical protein
MKKYRLIKLYPGSPELGYVIEKREGTNMYFYNGLQVTYPDKYPEFWEEVIEKDYEILTFTHNTSDGVVKVSKTDLALTVEEFLKNKCWKIHSVKRLSDGEVFTIGDHVRLIKQSCYFKIESLEINFNTITINKYLNTIDCYEKYRQPLFTTEDGVDMFEGDKYWYIKLPCKFNGFTGEHLMKAYSTVANKNNDTSCKIDNILGFSTKEAAEEYILMNKPCLSINDLKEIFIWGSNNESRSSTSIIDKLKQLVKSKL